VPQGETLTLLTDAEGAVLVPSIEALDDIRGRAHPRPSCVMTGFIAPGGPMNLMLGAYLTTIAFVCTGVAIARMTRADSLGTPTAPKTRVS